MDVCKSDVESIIRLLEKGAEYIERYSLKPRDQDKARQIKIMIKKLKRKHDAQLV